jgi:hypothetical protein
MNVESELPLDVIEAINANRKVEAIKRLRAHDDIGLEEAKDEVEAYMRQNPRSAEMPQHRTESGIDRVLLVLLIVAVVYGAYLYFN